MNMRMYNNLVIMAYMYGSIPRVFELPTQKYYLKHEAQPSVLDMIKREFECFE
jgi:hypothetical protein